MVPLPTLTPNPIPSQMINWCLIDALEITAEKFNLQLLEYEIRILPYILEAGDVAANYIGHFKLKSSFISLMKFNKPLYICQLEFLIKCSMEMCQ